MEEWRNGEMEEWRNGGMEGHEQLSSHVMGGWLLQVCCHQLIGAGMYQLAQRYHHLACTSPAL